MELKDRRYKVRVQTAESTGTTAAAIEFTDLDIEFNVKKSLYPEPNTASLTVYGLTQAHRQAIEALSLYDPKKIKGAKQKVDYDNAATKRPVGVSRAPKKGKIRVDIEAGYKDGTALIFSGDLRRAVPQYSGPEISLQIEGEDGGRAVLSSRVTHSFPAGTSKLEVVQECAKAMGVGLGNFREVQQYLLGTYPSGTVVNGSAADALRGTLRREGITYSIQNDVLAFRKAGQGSQVAALLIDKDHGLVNRPVRDATGAVMVTTLLIPNVAPGQYIDLRSEDYRGTYYIKAVESEGNTSSNTWYHQLECWPG